MISIRLFLLGTPRIERDGEIVELGLRKAVALIAYLAVSKHPQSRDLLAGLLWPECSQATARSNLRRTLYRIQQALGPGFLYVSQDALAIADDVGFWLDVSAFEGAIAGCLEEDSLVQTISPECKARLENAIAIYADDFMSGFFITDSAMFEEWQFFERERLQQLLAKALVQLAHAYLLEGNSASAIPFARRWLALDHLNEPAHRLLMELYSRSGQHSAALRQYQECSRLLEESLGATPEAETVQLYEAIRKGKEDWHVQRAKRPAEINYVKSGDVHIAYQVLGSAPVDLLVIHGFISHLEHNWELPEVAQAFNRLAGFSRLILFDKRGVGLSDRVGYPPTLEHTVDDARSVLDAVGSQHAVLFGYSEGGPASLMFSATYPERVTGLVLCETLAKGSRSPDYPWAMPEKAWDRWLGLFQQFYGKPVPYIYFAPSHVEDSKLWEWFAQTLRLASSPGEIQGVFEVLRNIDVREVLPLIRVPTLVIHRKGDQVFHVEAGRYLADHIPGARYVELPGNEHWFWLGDSEALTQEIENFVTQLTHPTEVDPAFFTRLKEMEFSLPNYKSPAGVDRRLVTILCIGILQENDLNSNKHSWLEETIGQEIKRFRGQQVKHGKNLYLAAFDGPSRAIQCGVSLREKVRQQGIHLRLALHTGECLIEDGELQGSAVEIAMAVLEVAKEEQVLVSRTVKDLVVGAGFSFEDCGAQQLGMNCGNWELFNVINMETLPQY